MRKQYHKIKRLQSKINESHTKNLAVIEQNTCNVSLVRWCIKEWKLILFMILAIGVAIPILYVEFCTPKIIIQAINVPAESDITKLGYTGNVIAEKLVDEINKIDLELRDNSVQKSWQKEQNNLNYEFVTTSQIPDIPLSTVQTSMQSMLRFIKQELGSNSYYIDGELVHDNNEIVLTLRNCSGLRT